MICLTSFFNKTLPALGLLLFLAAGRCALLEERREGEALRFADLAADSTGALVAHVSTVRWTAVASGGAGDIQYEFRTRQEDGAEYVEQKGASPTWDWRPRFPGIYSVRVVCRDAAGNEEGSGWSEAYTVTAPVDHGSLFTILPIENLSGVKAPAQMIDQALHAALAQHNFQLLDQETLKELMKKYRMRYTGGINYRVSKALREEEGVEAVLVVSLDNYQESAPPKISLLARLVLCAEPQPEILWMDSVGLTGEDAPEVFGLGRIQEMDRLLEKAIASLLASLEDYLVPVPARESVFRRGAAKVPKKYLPQTWYRSPEFDPETHYTIAVVPFLNINTRKNAGEVVPLHFVNQLLRQRNFTVIEPGLVREEFLNNRLIMEEGPSLAVSDLISGSNSLGVDLVLSGKVFDYQGLVGEAKVDFSTQVIDGKRREIIWASRSYGSGDEGVFFFDAGRVFSAGVLTERMSGAVVQLLTQ